MDRKSQQYPTVQYLTVGRAPEFVDIIGLPALAEFNPNAILPGDWPSYCYAGDDGERMSLARQRFAAIHTQSK